jgi:hypothetical protein
MQRSEFATEGRSSSISDFDTRFVRSSIKRDISAPLAFPICIFIKYQRFSNSSERKQSLIFTAESTDETAQRNCQNLCMAVDNICASQNRVFAGWMRRSSLASDKCPKLKRTFKLIENSLADMLPFQKHATVPIHRNFGHF